MKIEQEYVNGKIEEDYRDLLVESMNACHASFVKNGRLTDDRDARDWKDLGNGGRMRKVHKDSERAKMS